MLSLLLELIQSLLSKLIKFVLVHLTHLLNSLVLLLPNIAQLLIDRLVHILHDPGFTFLNLIVDLSHSLVLLKVQLCYGVLNLGFRILQHDLILLQRVGVLIQQSKSLIELFKLGFLSFELLIIGGHMTVQIFYSNAACSNTLPGFGSKLVLVQQIQFQFNKLAEILVEVLPELLDILYLSGSSFDLGTHNTLFLVGMMLQVFPLVFHFEVDVLIGLFYKGDDLFVILLEQVHNDQILFYLFTHTLSLILNINSN